MKKLLVLFSVLFTLNSFAQVKLGLNGNVFIPIAFLNQNPNYSRSIGLGLSAKYIINDSYVVGAFGSLNISNNNVPGSTGLLTNYGLSFEYLFQKSSFSPYIGSDIGYYNSSQASNFGFGGANNFRGIGIAPNLGVIYEFSETLSLDVNLKFHHIFFSPGDVNLFSISAGIVYKFPKNE